MEKFNLANVNEKVSDALTGIKKRLDSFVSEDEAFWMAVAMFLLGVIVGMLISPRKTKTIAIGNNNNAYGCDDDDDDDNDCDCGCGEECDCD